MRNSRVVLFVIWFKSGVFQHLFDLFCWLKIYLKVLKRVQDDRPLGARLRKGLILDVKTSSARQTAWCEIKKRVDF